MLNILFFGRYATASIFVSTVFFKNNFQKTTRLILTVHGAIQPPVLMCRKAIIQSIGQSIFVCTVDIYVCRRLHIGTPKCEPHTCPCRKEVNARDLHRLSCRRSGARQQRHAELNNIIWRSIKRAQIPVSKEPVGLSRTDEKRPDGATLIPWSRGKPLA